MSGLALKNVDFSYQEKSILKNLTLNIESGQLVCLLGPSGCGKSTLLRLFAGLLKPTSGELRLQDGRLSFVFQDARLLPWKNVIENVLFPFEISGEPAADPEDVLRRVGLWEARHLYPHQLSGGMKQRVSIARAAITEPQLLLMDEPFSALDESTRQDLEELLREFWAQTRFTVVFVTHSLPEAVFLGERVLVMGANGKILSDEKPQFLKRTPDLRTSTEFNEKVRQMSKLLRSARGPA